MARNFKTVSIDLVEYAEQVADHFAARGYTVKVELSDPSFPFSPTLVCRRQRTSIIIEVFEQISFDRMLAWISYAKRVQRDTRVAVCVSEKVSISTDHERILKDQGIGLYIATENGVLERIAPGDLALGISLPALNSLPRKLRPLLGPAYDQFERTQWREGFSDACQVLEDEARRYMKEGIRNGRITLIANNGRPRILTSAAIDRLTLGQLAQAFSQIRNQNQADAIIGHALSSINPERVGVVHHKSRASTERRLRQNVQQHMWTIVGALKALG